MESKEPKPSRNKATFTIDEIKDLVIFMKNNGVDQFAFRDFSAVFGPGQSRVATIDDKAARASELQALLKETVEDEQSNLHWST